MTIGFIFWLLMLLWLVGWIYVGYSNRPALGPPVAIGGSIMLFVLLFLLGWKTFGWPIAG